MATTPSRTTNTFDPVASHSSSRVFAKIASLAPRSCAYARARTFSAYDVVLRPAVAPRSLRTHGHDDHAHRVGPRAAAGLLATTTVGPLVPRSEPERRDAAGDGDAQAGFVVAVGRRAPRTRPRATRRDRGPASPRPDAECARRSRWRRPRERLAAVHADGLEHAVAHEQPVVERGDAGVVDGDQRAVDPDRHSVVRAALTTPPARRDVGAGHREQPRGLELGLGPLGVGPGVGDDAAADPEVGAPGVRRAEDGEGADGHGEVGGHRPGSPADVSIHPSAPQ